MPNAIARLGIVAALLSLPHGAVVAQDRSEATSDASHAMYLELQQRADSFVGKPLSFAGKVIQSIKTGQHYVLRVNVTPEKYNSWRDTIYVEYDAPAAAGENRIAEGELVSVRGTFSGVRSYQSVIGDTIKVPAVVACVIQSGVGNIPACPGEKPPANPRN